MRRKLVKWGAVVCIIAALLAFLHGKLPAKQDVSLAETSLEAADDLAASYQVGQNSLMFYSKEISELEVYHLLQAGEPYLSNLETATYQSGAVKLTWNIPQKQEQDDGLDAARKLGAKAVEGQTTITGKLQAIHDTLIRTCVYTENGEQRTQMAAGAVQDKQAVCAGYARAFEAMCDGAGLDVYYIEDDDMTHDLTRINCKVSMTRRGLVPSCVRLLPIRSLVLGKVVECSASVWGNLFYRLHL